MKIPTLRGRFVTLLPYEPSMAQELFRATEDGTFRYFLDQPIPWSAAGLDAWVSGHAALPGWFVFVVRRNADGGVAGCTSYIDVDAHHRRCEIGATWYAAGARGTVVNPECKLLLMTHAFEGPAWGSPVNRVQLKCDARNEHSARAIAKLGAVREGVWRSHAIRPDGSPRDSIVFSVIREEWPGVKRGLEERVAQHVAGDK